MADQATPTQEAPEPSATLSTEPTESFGDILSQYQKDSSRKTEGSRQLQGTVITVNAEAVFFDIGYKSGLDFSEVHADKLTFTRPPA